MLLLLLLQLVRVVLNNLMLEMNSCAVVMRRSAARLARSARRAPNNSGVLDTAVRKLLLLFFCKGCATAVVVVNQHVCTSGPHTAAQHNRADPSKPPCTAQQSQSKQAYRVKRKQAEQ
jgi:hypothetical protein